MNIPFAHLFGIANLEIAESRELSTFLGHLGIGKETELVRRRNEGLPGRDWLTMKKHYDELGARRAANPSEAPGLPSKGN
jgi:hypothetical protein